ncbi:MAG: hypothetical protein NXY59_03175 [Aigarchaeota archaeon]|nr:hypothetical protein [Candidatus Pelearchaeum maunauluense]
MEPATSFVVEVREDVRLGADRTVATYEGYGSLSQRFCLTYRPSSSVRGYFLRVTLSNGEVWEQEGYPPRLALQMPAKGRLSIVNVWWSSDGRQVTSVKVGSPVTAHVLITAVGGEFSGKIDVVIKQDIALSPEVEVRRASFTASLAAREAGSLRLVSRLSYLVETLLEGITWKSMLTEQRYILCQTPIRRAYT